MPQKIFPVIFKLIGFSRSFRVTLILYVQLFKYLMLADDATFDANFLLYKVDTLLD